MSLRGTRNELYALGVAFLLTVLIPTTYWHDLHRLDFVTGFPFQTVFISSENGSYAFNVDYLAGLADVLIWYVLIKIVFSIHSKILKLNTRPNKECLLALALAALVAIVVPREETMGLTGDHWFTGFPLFSAMIKHENTGWRFSVNFLPYLANVVICFAFFMALFWLHKKMLKRTEPASNSHAY